MRRKENEITDRSAIESIIHGSSICRLALSEDDHPYIVPLNFGYKDKTLYFHSAREGKKLDMLRKNNKVCFEFDIDGGLLESDTDNACEWGFKYRSVIGFGKASLIDDPESKRRAFDVIMQHYSDSSLSYKESAIKKVVIIKVEIEDMTGKQSGY